MKIGYDLHVTATPFLLTQYLTGNFFIASFEMPFIIVEWGGGVAVTWGSRCIVMKLANSSHCKK